MNKDLYCVYEVKKGERITPFGPWEEVEDMAVAILVADITLPLSLAKLEYTVALFVEE